MVSHSNPILGVLRSPCCLPPILEIQGVLRCPHPILGCHHPPHLFGGPGVSPSQVGDDKVTSSFSPKVLGVWGCPCPPISVWPWGVHVSVSPATCSPVSLSPRSGGVPGVPVPLCLCSGGPGVSLSPPYLGLVGSWCPPLHDFGVLPVLPRALGVLGCPHPAPPGSLCPPHLGGVPLSSPPPLYFGVPPGVWGCPDVLGQGGAPGWGSWGVEGPRAARWGGGRTLLSFGIKPPGKGSVPATGAHEFGFV